MSTADASLPRAEELLARLRTRVGLELTVAYGRVLPEVAHDVQERVAAALGTMCGVNVTAVDVSVEELE
jgi:uncharacterized alkaline shock family protein YloU